VILSVSSDPTDRRARPLVDEGGRCRRQIPRYFVPIRCRAVDRARKDVIGNLTNRANNGKMSGCECGSFRGDSVGFFVGGPR